MALYEVKERIRKKKKRKRKRIITTLIILFLIGVGVTLFTSSRFQVKQVIFTGNQAIPMVYLEKEAEALKGENLFLPKKKEVLSFLESKAYFASMKMRRKFPDTLQIEITEKVAEINYAYQGVINLLTKEGVLLETGSNLLEEGLLLLDEKELPDVGQNLYEDDEIKQKVLMEFRTLQTKNQSDIKFNEVDLSNMTMIKTYYQDLEILLGYPESLREKLNGAINIIKDGQLEQVIGYVDVSYLEHPVVFDEALATPVEAIETPTE